MMACRRLLWLCAVLCLVDEFSEATRPVTTKRLDDFVSLEAHKWPNKTIPYEFDQLNPTPYETMARDVISYFEDTTCLAFIEKDTPEAAGVDMTRRVVIGWTLHGCWAFLGRSTGSQLNLINLSDSCGKTYVVWHEIAHALGVPHEQMRKDRDDFVVLLWENIDMVAEHNFKVLPTNENVLYTPYDMTSLMAYHEGAFSKNYKRTIEAKEPHWQDIMNIAKEATHYDTMAINIHYDCASECVNPPVCENYGYVDKHCTCVCPAGLMGPTCNQNNDTYLSTPGCGGLFRYLSMGETFNFSTRRDPDFAREPCAWRFTADFASKIVLTFPDWHVDLKHVVLIGFALPGQEPTIFERRDCYNPPAPYIVARPLHDYNRKPWIEIYSRPGLVGSDDMYFNASVTVSPDHSMDNPTVFFDAESLPWEVDKKLTNGYYDLGLSTANLPVAHNFKNVYHDFHAIQLVSTDGSDTGYLQTKVYWVGSEDVCVTFGLYMFGVSGTISIKTVDRAGVQTTVANVAENTDAWIQKNITISEAGPYRVRLEYGPIITGETLPYLDLLSIQTCDRPLPQPELLEYPWEFAQDMKKSRSMENFHVYGELAGKIRRGYMGSHYPGTGNQSCYVEDYCLVFSATTDGVQGTKGNLVPKWIFDGSVELCVEFAYVTAGEHPSTLQFVTLEWGPLTETVIWEKTENIQGWRIANFTVPPTYSPYYVGWIFTHGSGRMGDLVLDAINFRPCVPVTTLPPVLPIVEEEYYSFEEGDERAMEPWMPGGNTQRDQYNHTWWLHTGKTPTGNTGPSRGISSDWYIYMEGTGNSPGGIAEITTRKVYRVDSTVEFISFIYLETWTKVEQMGELYILLKEAEGPGEVILAHITEISHFWEKHPFTIVNMTYPYRIAFRGVVGSGEYSDIAVDRISITHTYFAPLTTTPEPTTTTPGEPATQPTTTTTTTREPTTTTRKQVIPTSIGDRVSNRRPRSGVGLDSAEDPFYMFHDSFEVDNDDFTKAGDYTWRMQYHATTDKKVGQPLGARDGIYYMTLYSDDNPAAGIATLTVDPAVEARKEMCVMFDFHHNGAGKLEVVIKKLTGLETVVWSKTESHAFWRLAHINVPVQDGTYQVMFRVIHTAQGAVIRSDVSIDDLLVAEAPCRRVRVGEDCGSCQLQEGHVSGCTHLRGLPVCTAYGHVKEAEWHRNECSMDAPSPHLHDDDVAQYHKTCFASECNNGRASDGTTPIRTLQYKTPCDDQAGQHCYTCCETDCGTSHAFRHTASSSLLMYAVFTLYIALVECMYMICA